MKNYHGRAIYKKYLSMAISCKLMHEFLSKEGCRVGFSTRKALKMHTKVENAQASFNHSILKEFLIRRAICLAGVSNNLLVSPSRTRICMEHGGH